MTPLAAEAAYYRDLDAAYARDEWIERRVGELTANPVKVVDEIGELSPALYEDFAAALAKVIAAKPADLLAARNALCDVFTDHFTALAEAEYDTPQERDYYYDEDMR